MFSVVFYTCGGNIELAILALLGSLEFMFPIAFYTYRGNIKLAIDFCGIA